MEQNELDNLTSAPPGKKRVTGWQRDVVIFLDKQILAFLRHWAVSIALVVGLGVTLAVAAPIAMHYGYTGVANVIYKVYGPPVCHHLAFRSWFLFGEQMAYPLELAGLPGPTFEDYARLEPAFANIDLHTLNDTMVYVAVNFPGNPQMGWKIALCERCLAMYGSIALFALAYALMRRLKIRVPYMPFLLYVLAAIIPIGIDGASQWLSIPPLNSLFAGFARESTPVLRTLTGVLFGLGSVWLAFPYIEDSMRETRILIENKLARAGVIRPSNTPIPGQTES